MVDRAVRSQGDRETQAAVDLAARFRRIVECTDALDLRAPSLLVQREAVLGCARTDEALATDGLYLVGPAGDRLTAKASVRFVELADLPLVLPGAPDGFRMMLAETAKKCGFALKVAVEVDSLTAMKEIVAGGSGYTVLTQQAVLPELSLKRVQTALVVEPSLSRTLVLATSAQRPLTSASRVVAGLIRQMATGKPSGKPEGAG